MNHSRVLPARLEFELKGKTAEILLLRPLSEGGWEALVRPGKYFKAGASFALSSKMRVSVLSVNDSGTRILEFEGEDFRAYLKAKGQMPTPPYIRQKLEDPERYQTVYAQREGSAAAPTAGLHFTVDLMEKLKKKGVQMEFVTLNVGLGTFQPMKTQNPLEHKMHHEWFNLEEATAKRLNQAKAEGRRIIAVGTTSVRVLESCANDSGILEARSGETDIFIYPGYRWKFVNGLITNFHVPKSTLLMLASSFADSCHPASAAADEEFPIGPRLSGREFILKAYQEAIEKEYRFFSFGDAMLIE